LKLNPSSEVAYRVRLAKGYLRDAEESYRRRDYRGTVASAQLRAENAAKAIITVYRVPSWTRDPSRELVEVAQSLDSSLRVLAEELAEIAKRLAPERGRATYGEPTRGLTPWDIYGEEDALTALTLARRALELAKNILEGIDIKLE